MRIFLSSQKVLELYPSLPSSIRRLMSPSSIIEQLSGQMNTVLSIDDKYILRTKKIHLYDFDDIGGCNNFKLATDYVEEHKFEYHPNNIILKKVTLTDGTAVEYLLYDKSSGITFSSYLKTKTHSNSKVENLVIQSAQLLAKLHRIPAPQYGFFWGQQFDTWTDFIRYWIEKQSKYIKKNKTLTDTEIACVKSIFNANLDNLSITHPSTIHLDLKSTNIIISPNGDKIECLIDWDNTRGGDPIADVSYTIERIHENEGLSRFSPLFLEEYMRASNVLNRDVFMLKYKLYSLFYAYKLLPVHAMHTSQPSESVVSLTKYIRKILPSFTS